jgi:hypothetical protein
MQEFTKSMPFIITFLFTTLLLSMTTNGKVTQGFLWLVLVSMILLNQEKFTKLIGGVKYE